MALPKRGFIHKTKGQLQPQKNLHREPITNLQLPAKQMQKQKLLLMPQK